ncbi:OmpA family protein [Hyunsoonleella pacifica]|uniref:Flagellar motor protein MotB n=1 Tax=Hyunsoonleella pacifica TaxID=1080224 RepID=A0A4Q9FQL9_9FLAO|nr:OmpA family protein [Hyunsoonleella pacifica]TBN15559.1 flagellar motor protein MotB [Hyunsoonleella pacifica]GGD25028.1 cell envelope biogenesis protein OmpA [Hyunsoonleella pacifica]
MKNIITLLLLAAVSIIQAQNSNEKADRLFDRMWYKEASALYELELKKAERKNENFSNSNDSTYVNLLKRAGDSYYFNTDMENAHRWYDKLVSNYYSSVDAEYVFRYAHALQGIGQYRDAKRWMKEFSKRTENKDDRSPKFSQKKITVEDILDIEPRFVLKNISTNTKYSDFGPMYYKDKLVYSSAVDSSTFHTRIYHWNEQPFLNMYLGELNEIQSDVKLIDEFSDKLNTRYHEATLAFSPDETKVYFTRNNYDGDLGRDGKGTNHLKLYSAELRRNRDSVLTWQNVKELPFNSEDYSVGHPTVSKDGKLLYFVSDMPGSIGATDIFVVDILEENETTKKDSTFTGYSRPRNLGTKVNTAGREMFPYITNNALYFASDGHLGLGGLDVYESRINEGQFINPVNLGAPLNSKLDDFGFIVNEPKDRGFVCSNRLTGKGDDDIYSFVRLPAPDGPLCEQAIRGYVSNSITGERISNVNMALLSDTGKLLETTTTNIAGAYTFNTVLDCATPYKVTAEKTGYEPKEKPMLTLNENGETVVALGLETLNELIVEEKGVLKIKIGIIYFDLDKSFIRNDAAIELNKIVLLMTQYPKMVIKIESHTDSRNSNAYNLSLSDRRAKSTRDYIISQGIDANRIESANGFGESQLINNCADGISCSEAEHQLNRRSEFIIVKM